MANRFYRQNFVPFGILTLKNSLARLNEMQRRAVFHHPAAPLLILAGAGSGKTTVLVKPDRQPDPVRQRPTAAAGTPPPRH